MNGLWTRYRKVLVGLARPGLTVLTTLLVVLLLVVPWTRPTGLVLTIAVTAVLWWTIRRGSHPAHSPRAALLGALVVVVWQATPGDWLLGLAGLATLAVSLADQVAAHLGLEKVGAWQLPGFTMPRRSDAVSALFEVSCGLTVLLALTGLGLPPLVFELATLAGLAIGAGLALRAMRSAQARRRAATIERALAAHGPRFAILFSGKPEAAYQIAMWLPYLERTGEPYVLIVRERDFLPVARRLTTAPVLYAGRPESVGRLLVPSIGAVFYVNNEAKNAQGVRFRGPTHVHLGHGDSDKPPSYHPMTAMFDEIFVAGQAGIDRYASHQVAVPPEKFRIVGRPQVERVEPARDPRPQPPTVLYAPTWRGGLSDMGFGSLRHGATIVAGLLARGVTVSFRPHPYSYRDADSRLQIQQIDALLAAAGAQHRGPAATAEQDILDCLNAADALVTDLSSVASDFLQSGKPLAITDMGVVAGPLAEAFPVARAAYILRPEGELDAVFAAMRGDDPLAGERERIRRYYLGGPEVDSEVFVAAVRAAIARGTRPA